MDINNKKPHINVDYFEDLTGNIEHSKHNGVEEIGERLRKLRQEKGLSLKELADKTGFDSELLSKIETKEIYPQLGTVIKLSKAFDAAFGTILSGSADQTFTICKKQDQKVTNRSTSTKGKRHVYSYKTIASEVKDRNMEPLIVELQQTSEKDISVHEGEEFIYVLDGIVVLEIGNEHFELKPGDSAYYYSSNPHWITAKDNTATILAIIYQG